MSNECLDVVVTEEIWQKVEFEQHPSGILMAKHLKVRSEKGDVIANRDAVNVLLVQFGYPALLSKKALESLIHRERKAKEKSGHSCQI